MADEERENSKEAVKGEEEKKVGGTIKKIILRLLIGCSCTNYFLVIFFAIVIFFSVFVGVSPASENDDITSPTGLCVPLQTPDPNSASQIPTGITNWSGNDPSLFKKGDFFNMESLTGTENYDINRAGSTGQHWGRPELISLLQGVAGEWNKRHPDTKIVMGDLSGYSGGQLDSHASHQIGVDVDIYDSGSASFLYDSPGSYDPNLAIELGKIFMDTKSIIYIFYNDTAVQKEVNGYVSQNNLSGSMTTEPGHLNHFHVRIDVKKYKEACGY